MSVYDRASLDMSFSDSDSSMSDLDEEEIERQLKGMQSLLHRYVGQHKAVGKLRSDALVSERGFFLQTTSLEGGTAAETVKRVDEAEEKEKKRRTSMPFTGTDNTEHDIEEIASQLSSCHEELLHLFAVHEAKYQTDCERERRVLEDSKKKMHEELIRRATLRDSQQQTEIERERKIQQLEKMMSGHSEEGEAMAETNDRLSRVHSDLRKAFAIMQQAKKSKEERLRREAEEMKEMMLQQIRRQPSSRDREEQEEVERSRRIAEYQSRIFERSRSDDKLIEVQEQLLKIFGKLKKGKLIKKMVTEQEQADKKVLMQEELLHRVHSKQVEREEAMEKTRRIKETLSEEVDPARQKAINMLLDTQNELLTVFGNVRAFTLKMRMEQLKILKHRTKVLADIRRRRQKSNTALADIDENPSPIKGTSPHVLPGRRLSLIGEKLQHKAADS